MRTDSVFLLFYLSVCKTLCMYFHEIFTKERQLVQSQGDFILEVIRVDINCHLEVTVTQQSRLA